jgi:indoleamine 2,3-dioxygenase
MSAKTLNPSDYGISPKYGFLSPDPPAWAFSDNYYKQWDELIENLSSLIKSGRIYDEIEKLPLLETNRLNGEVEYRRAYVVLAFLTHAYVWGQQPPKPHIPPQISEPFLAVCKHLGIAPVITYAALCTWNWKLRNGGGFDLDNLEAIGNFTGTRDEAAFYHTPVMTEYESGRLMHVLLDALVAAEEGRSQMVIEALRETSQSIVRMGHQMGKLYPRLDVNVFYHQHRPFMAGGKGMEEKGLPDGMVFQKSDGIEEAHKLVGGSAIQSALFPFIDHVLGVAHGDSVFKVSSTNQLCSPATNS